jgi:hypothetical protein
MKKSFKIILFVIGGVILLCLLVVVAIILIGSSPAAKANATKLAQDRDKTLTANAPTLTLSPTSTPTITDTPTIDPFFTPPTPTSTATFTLTATVTRTPTKTPLPTKTNTPTKTQIPSRTPISTRTPTIIPSVAGVSDWISYQDKLIGVREIVFSNYLGYFVPETGKIFVSLYVVAINNSTQEYTFSDLELVDGGGEITYGVVLAKKEPSFSSCTIKPGGTCEGWWTTMIWNRPEVKSNLKFRWNPCLILCPAMETAIRQKP